MTDCKLSNRTVEVNNASVIFIIKMTDSKWEWEDHRRRCLEYSFNSSNRNFWTVDYYRLFNTVCAAENASQDHICNNTFHSSTPQHSIDNVQMLYFYIQTNVKY